MRVKGGANFVEQVEAERIAFFGAVDGDAQQLAINLRNQLVAVIHVECSALKVQPHDGFGDAGGAVLAFNFHRVFFYKLDAAFNFFGSQ